MPDTRRIPFTEIVERVQKELVRDASASEGKYKSRVNDEYTLAIPGEIDYRHIQKTGTVTTWPSYTTGTVAVTNGSTTITGTSTAWDTGADAGWVAGTDTMLINLGNYDETYRITYVGATSGTLDRAWVEATDTSETYTLYQDRYALPSDFSRLIEDPDECIYYWRNGVKVYLKYLAWGEFQRRQSYVAGTAPDTYHVRWVNDDPYLYINYPTSTAITVYFDYIPSLARMTEYTTSTVKALANGAAAVELNAGDADGYLADFDTYSYYFRVDGDGTGGASIWYEVLSATDDTNFTLSTNYEGTTITAGTSAYTLSKVSLLPDGLDTAIMYGAALISAIDQDNDTQIKSWSGIHRLALDRYKRIEATRGYGKQRLRTIYEKSGVRR